MKTNNNALRLPALLIAAVVLFHLYFAKTLGFHRDEFLYLALGRHLDWGYWSNPPFIGFLSRLSQFLPFDALTATRFFPALAAGILLWLMLSMVRAWGGGAWAQLLAGLSMFGSIAWLRAFSMLQPVPFDIVFWALLSYLLLQWLKTGETRWWWYIGLTGGFGVLNKYTVVLWVLALLPALLASEKRRTLLSGGFWSAAGIALVVVLPNLIWQWHYDFPVLRHMAELRQNQLQYVRPAEFLGDQILMHMPYFVLWMPGLWALLRGRDFAPYRVLGLHFVLVLLILLVLKGKGYYALGAYPVLFAAGAVYWERVLTQTITRTALATSLVLLSLPLSPTGLPFLPTNQLVSYFKRLKDDAGLDAPLRWEGGSIHALPQDYADMLGWEQLAAAADQALEQAGGRAMLYCENYGQAGAVEQLSTRKAVACSFADSYLLWAPEQLEADCQYFIYINDEMGEDVKNLFGDIRVIGVVTDTLAREYGTTVYLCSAPKGDFASLWARRVREEKARLR